MSEKPEQTVEEKLAKMRSILASHTRRRKRLGRQLKRAEKRLDGATRDVLKRRFQFDIDQLCEQLQTTKDKEAWARRMVRSLEVAACTNEAGDLIQKPFAKLAGIKLG